MVWMIKFGNLSFWSYYFSTSFPNAFNEETEKELSELVEEIFMLDSDELLKWTDNFTGYYDGVMDENDGYLDDPNKLEIMIRNKLMLKIEYHPDDTIYFINNSEIVCTGPHWSLYHISWKELLAISSSSEYQDYAFWLLLPMTRIANTDDIDEVNSIIKDKLEVFNLNIRNKSEFVDTIVAGLSVDEEFSLNENINRYIFND